MKRTPADIAFSKCIRERTDWICELCDRDFSHNKGQLECSHYFGRAARCIRFDPDNAFAHCNGCHRQIGAYPDEFYLHYLAVRGEGRLALLREKRAARVKITKIEEKLIAKHFRQELKLMEKERNKGTRGYLDFVGY